MVISGKNQRECRIRTQDNRLRCMRMLTLLTIICDQFASDGASLVRLSYLINLKINSSILAIIQIKISFTKKMCHLLHYFASSDIMLDLKTIIWKTLKLKERQQSASMPAHAAIPASKMTPVNSGRMLLPRVVSGLRILGLVLPVVSLALVAFLLAKTFVSTQGVRCF